MNRVSRTRLDALSLTRRAFAAGMVVSGFLTAPTRAQQDDSPPEDLSVNLLTRMAAIVRINGREALFVLDTGAQRTALSSDLAVSLGLEAGPALDVHGVTALQRVGSVMVGRLTFGGRRFQNLVAPVFPRESVGADGLVGLDVLSAFSLDLDLTRREVRMQPTGDRILTGVLPTRLSREGRARTGRFGQLILLNCRADEQAVEAFVDSGAQYSIGNLALLSAIGGTAELDRIDVHGVTGQTLSARPGRVRALRISGRDLGETPLLFADLHAFEALGLADRPALLLGADVLYRFDRIVLDYGRGRVAFGAVRPPFAPPAASL